MNFWPSDERSYYYDAAIQVPHLKHISEIHKSLDTDRVKWLHGKEMFILSCSIMQGLMNDYDSLRPLTLVCVISICLSAMLLFFIARFYWGPTVALACYVIFVTSFWPYSYILFVKHQPLGLFYFLFSLFLMQSVLTTRLRKILYLFSGFFLCSAIHASTVATLYLPFYLAAFLYQQKLNHEKEKNIFRTLKDFILAGLLIMAGFGGSFIYFNYPDVLYNITSYLRYVEISGSFNHFYYNQPVLQQWFDVAKINRAGWIWVIKYFLIIMPVLFPFYGLSLFYLLVCPQVRSPGSKRKIGWYYLSIFGLIFLSATPVLLAEIKKVAQYGANYFPAMLGILLLVGYALFMLFNSQWFFRLKTGAKRSVVALLCLILFGHTIWNGYIFLTDIYPCRLVTTFLSQELKKLGINHVYTYHYHPQRANVVDNLDPQLLKDKLQLVFVDNIYQVPEGYIIVPPMTGNSIYIGATSKYNDYYSDIYFNELMRKGIVSKYAVASYQTLASSRIWPHEEEILSYRYLILNQFPQDDIQQGKDRVWVLAAQKLLQDIKSNMPPEEYVNAVLKGLRMIGRKDTLYAYEGDSHSLDRPMILQRFPTRVFKVGEPTDGLRLYLYKVDEAQPMWVPYGPDFVSEVVPASKIPRDESGKDANGKNVSFGFGKDLLLVPGPYLFVIYRTGPHDDQNFYKIYMENPDQLERDINKTATPFIKKTL